MHKQAFISHIQELLGNFCSEEEARRVFNYARQYGLVDSDNNGDWFFMDEEFNSNDNYLVELYKKTFNL